MSLDPVRVLIVDDHAIFRMALSSYLESRPEVAVVGVAADAGEAIDLALTQNAQVILMDISLPDASGFEATRRLRAVRNTARILAMTGRSYSEVSEELQASGMDGYISKDGIHNAIVDAVVDAASRPSAG